MGSSLGGDLERRCSLREYSCFLLLYSLASLHISLSRRLAYTLLPNSSCTLDITKSKRENIHSLPIGTPFSVSLVGTVRTVSGVASATTAVVVSARMAPASTSASFCERFCVHRTCCRVWSDRKALANEFYHAEFWRAVGKPYFSRFKCPPFTIYLRMSRVWEIRHQFTRRRLDVCWHQPHLPAEDEVYQRAPISCEGPPGLLRVLSWDYFRPGDAALRPWTYGTFWRRISRLVQYGWGLRGLQKDVDLEKGE